MARKQPTKGHKPRRKAGGYVLPSNPKLTVWEVLAWVRAQRAPVSARQLASHFDITISDAGNRVMKLHRWGLLRRRKNRDRKAGRRAYLYEASAYGKRFRIPDRKA